MAALTAANEHQRAVNAACLLLSYRPRSVREVETRLRRHGYSPAPIAAARQRRASSSPRCSTIGSSNVICYVLAIAST